tara:strand:+ start:1643 stop:3277 length:1635 start_codon:yes stop_codon:yes gene_type:complete
MTNHIIEKIENRNRPMPEVFTRRDIRNTGGWDVGRARAVRGEPFITVSGRIMRVPLDDSNLARSIRGHEQIHVKVSPQDLTPYINEVTPEGAIRAAEEARVNFIAESLGFPMKDMITGSEKHDGEVLVATNSWAESVYAVAASIHTGGLRPLLTGMRREAPAWADQLRVISKEFVKFQKNQIREIKKHYAGVQRTDDSTAFGIYGSTESADQNPEWISGMSYTVEFAMLIEGIASLPAPPMEMPEQVQSSSDESEEDESDEGQEELEADGGQEGDGEISVDHEAGLDKDTKKDELSEDAKMIDRKDIQKRAKEALNSRIARKGGLGNWIPVKVDTGLPLTLNVQGAIGKKRVASNVGRNPRRIQRLLTDPERRIFDKKVKAQGGVVLIDVSGSMSLSKDQVKDMMMAAPGCTVIAYSCGWDTDDFNTFILADKGKVFGGSLPRFFNGNGNDLPAIEYAVSKRQTIGAPVVWITDGMVYRPSGASSYDERECALYAKKFNVHMEYEPEGAIEYLKGLQRGQKPSPRILERWEEKLSGVVKPSQRS